MVKKIIFFVLLASRLGASTMTGLYDEFLKPGAESKGHAYALTASREGLLPLFYNPANLAFLKDSFHFYFSRENFSLVNDITHLCFSAGGRLSDSPPVAAALSWRKLDYFDAVAYDDNENILQATVAWKSSFLRLGASGKYYISQIRSPVLRVDHTGVGLDAGFSVEAGHFLFSFAALNLVARMKYPDGYAEDLESQVNCGLSFTGFENAVLYADASRLFDDNLLGLAASYALAGNIGFFAGVNSDRGVGAGLSFTVRGFSLKYGYCYSLSGLYSDVSFSLSYGF